MDGFKNLRDFEIDLGPFNCIAGPNGVGKSNIFDAVRFLSLLADHSLEKAALKIRDADPETTRLDDLFWTDGLGRKKSFQIAAEMIVDLAVVDDFGREAKATSTFLRYEIEIGYRAPGESSLLGRLVLLRENLRHITEGQARDRIKFPHKPVFRKEVVKNTRRGGPFIFTEKANDGQLEINIAQDSGSFGRPQKLPALSSPRTVVGNANTTATPTILAARREMQSWRFLALEPSAMRRVDRFHSPATIASNGEHLPAALFRLANEAEKNGLTNPQFYARIANKLAELVPVKAVVVKKEDVRQLLELAVTEQSGTVLPARSLSDGTLRFLILCVLGEDPDLRGLVCFEEPENGIHPLKMDAMVTLLRDLAFDPREKPGLDNPLRQVIIATHSPLMVQLQNPNDLLCTFPTAVRGHLVQE